MLDSQTSLVHVAHSAQALATVKSSTRDASRVLCLRLQEQSSSFGIKTKKRTARAIAETFLKFSPRLVFRNTDDISNGRLLWLFIDIASTAHLFNGEEECSREACALAQALGFGVQFALADTPSGAQAFTLAHPNSICPPGEEREHLKKLSLPLLLHLEGLEAWESPSKIESILTFFLMIGFKTAGDLSKLSSASFRERWGSLGLLFWRRVNALDIAPISPLAPSEPLEDYVHLDFPITLVSLLLRHSEKSLDYLFARLQGRRLFASRMVFTFHCEYSCARHTVVVEPNTPSRNRELFVTLLENKLDSLNLENPIRDFEVSLVTCEERAPQLDFFEPRMSHRDRLETLFSVLLQSSVQPGLYELQEAVMPEESWRLVQEELVRPEDMTSRRLERAGRGVGGSETRSGGNGMQTRTRHSWAQERAKRERETDTTPAVLREFYSNLDASDRAAEGYQQLALSFPHEMPAQGSMVAERSIAYTPRYGETVSHAPRPSRLLNDPIPLTIEDLERLKILTAAPIERLESGWWEDERARTARQRDYYFAVSPEGQCLWIYQDLMTSEHFLHGYFD